MPPSARHVLEIANPRVRGAYAMWQMRGVAPLAIMAGLVYPGGAEGPALGKEVALMKRLVMLVAILAMTVVLAVPALAQGQVERGPEHANSICSYSGLNDDPTDPEDPGRVQSYGQIVKAGGKAFAPSPGLLCNGHLFPYPEAFPDETP